MRCLFAGAHTYVNVNVNNLLVIPESDFDNSGEPGPQADVLLGRFEHMKRHSLHTRLHMHRVFVSASVPRSCGWQWSPSVTPGQAVFGYHINASQL